MALRLWRCATQHCPGVTQHDALDLWFQCHFQIGLAALGKAFPGVPDSVGDSLQACIHLGVDVLHDCRQQPLLVAEVVVERATGQTRLCGKVIH
ncbi:hypothetical protein D3C77_430990 [compost metagenome]